MSARGLRRGLLITALVLGVALFAGPSAADHGAETITILDDTVIESDGPGVEATFTVTLSEAPVLLLTVDYTTIAGSATAGSDYTTTNGTLNWLPTDPLTKAITVPILGDTAGEDTETFTVHLSNASNATISDSDGLGTINDNDPPTNTSPPTISGTTTDGQTLSSTNGTWNGTPTITFARQWRRCTDLTLESCTNIGGATGVNYTLVPADVGNRIRVVVTASNGGGSTPASSDATAVIAAAAPGNTSSPTVSGTTTDGQTLTGGDGTWSGTPPLAFARQWRRCTDATPGSCIDITGATGPSYVLQPADVGKRIRFQVTASNAAGPTTATSAATAVVGAEAPVNTALPAISGAPVLGQTLSASNGSWSGTPTITFAYQWRRCDVNGAGCVNIVGATGSTYTVVAADVGVTVRAVVTAANTGGSNTATSADRAIPKLTINDVSITEGASGDVTATFTVTLAPRTDLTATTTVVDVPGSATRPADYDLTGGDRVFVPGGATTKLIDVTIKHDLLNELSPETYTIRLAGAENATIIDADGAGQIVDNDSLPTISIANAPAVTEGNPSAFTVNLSAASGQQVTVQFATANGTATAPGDFTAPPGGSTLMFAPGETSKAISVATVNDPQDEPLSETFTVTLSAPTNATVAAGQGTATATINDNDDPPTISIADASAFEGNSGGLGSCGAPPPPGQLATGCVFMTVSLLAASGQPVTVQYSTSDGSAIAPDDYASIPATTITFAAGETTKTIGVGALPGVRVNGDPFKEPNETVNVNLSAATNATIADGVGIATILDEDDDPRLTVTGAQDSEAEGAIVVVALAPASGQIVTVNFATTSGTAAAGSDFTPIPPSTAPCSGPAGSSPCTLTFSPGQTSKAITIGLLNDALDEDNETFTVNLSNETNATILNGNDRFGIVTIVDDDGPPSVSIGDASVTEGGAQTVNASFPVTLSAPSGRAVSINYAAANGSAAAPEDYAASAGTLSFAPGETSKTVVVPVNGDTSVEADETFTVGLSGPVNVTVADGQAVGTIVNDDASPPPPPPPPPPPEPPPPTSTTTTGPTTSTTTTAGPPPPPPPPPTFGGMKISAAPVTLFDDLAPIGVTCSRQATGTCTGTVLVRGQVRVLAIVHGKPSVKAITLGRESFAIPRGRSEKVLVFLNKRALKAVKRAGRLKVTVVVTARDSARKRAKQVSRALWLRTAKAPAPKKAKTSSARR